ncbi:forkhead box protein H1-like [Acanthaster planci]|uniref:Forkhead box protein H1-like n=1 Tax=Acanthaster planci TaxID=133434 RepID=A0A8B7ZX27_ACAPL|nr:forkhead box protein H1-like [Acanthaster planci]
MAPSSPANDCDVTPPSGTGKGKSRRPNYRRRIKSPYSFAELIAMAIKESETGKMTLKEIQRHMSASYECFRGSYDGWKNSVRHNLSTSSCFVKVLKNKTKPNGKDNFWALNPDCAHCSTYKARYPVQKYGAPRDSDAEPQTIPPSVSAPGVVSSAVHSGNSTDTATCPTTGPDPLSNVTGDVAAGSHTGAAVSKRRPCSPLPTNLKLSTADPSDCTASTASHPSDEWNISVSDLYIPDGDIDLSLYNDDAWMRGGSETRQIPQPPAGNFHPEHRRAPPTCAGNVIDAPYHALPLESAYSQSAPPAQPAKFRIKSEYLTTSRYHPYDARQNIASLQSQYYSDYFINYSCRHAVSRRGFHGYPRLASADESRTVPGSLHGDSVLGSAIRSSLGLDLDEMALCAIEHSVRVLDVTRPGDLLSA